MGSVHSKLRDHSLDTTDIRTGVFDMALVEKVESVMRSMDKLILEDKKKQLLLALTDRVRGKSLAPWPPDFIKGKGEGMVVLLYGNIRYLSGCGV